MILRISSDGVTDSRNICLFFCFSILENDVDADGPSPGAVVALLF